MKVTLVLSPRDAAGLTQFDSAPHAALSPAQFAVRFGPSTATVQAIRTWAHANRLTVGTVSANRLLVTVSGSSTAIASALQTDFRAYSSNADGRFYSVSRPARLPQAFAAQVSAVLGLSSLSHLTVTPPATRSATLTNRVLSSPALTKLGPGLPSLNYPTGYDPKGFWSLYDAPAAQTGSGQQLAIITEGDLRQPTWRHSSRSTGCPR